METLAFQEQFRRAIVRLGDYYAQFLTEHEHDPSAVRAEYANILLSLDGSAKVENRAALATGVHHLYEYWRASGLWDDAIGYLQTAFDVAAGAGDLSIQARVANDLGIFYRLKGNLKKAVECYSITLSCWETLGNRSGIASAHANLGIVNTQMGNATVAEELLLKSLVTIEAEGDVLRAANQYENLNRVYADQLGKFKLAREYLMKGLKIRRRAGDIHAIGQDLISLGIVDVQCCRWERAWLDYQRARRLLAKSDDRHLRAMICEGEGVLYHLSGKTAEDWKHSRSLLDKATGLYGQLGQIVQGIDNAYLALGDIQRDLGEWDAALSCYEQAKSPTGFSELDSGHEAQFQSHAATILMRKGLWQAAMPLLQKAIGWFAERGNRLALAPIHGHLCEAYLMTGDVREAFKQAQLCLALARGPGDKYEPGLALAYRVHGNVFHHQAKYREARATWDKSLRVCLRWGMWYEAGQTHRAIARYSIDRDDADKHLEHARTIFSALGAARDLDDCVE